jgi:hypothetical protein
MKGTFAMNNTAKGERSSPKITIEGIEPTIKYFDGHPIKTIIIDGRGYLDVEDLRDALKNEREKMNDAE